MLHASILLDQVDVFDLRYILANGQLTALPNDLCNNGLYRIRSSHQIVSLRTTLSVSVARGTAVFTLGLSPLHDPTAFMDNSLWEAANRVEKLRSQCMKIHTIEGEPRFVVAFEDDIDLDYVETIGTALVDLQRELAARSTRFTGSRIQVKALISDNNVLVFEKGADNPRKPPDIKFFCDPYTFLVRSVIPTALAQTRLRCAVTAESSALFGLIPTKLKFSDGHAVVTDGRPLTRGAGDMLHLVPMSEYIPLLLKAWPGHCPGEESLLRNTFKLSPGERYSDKTPNWYFVAKELTFYQHAFYITAADNPFVPLAGVGVRCVDGVPTLHQTTRLCGGSLIPYVDVQGIHSMLESGGSDRLFSRIVDYVHENVPLATIVNPRQPLESMRHFMLRRGGCMSAPDSRYSCLVVHPDRMWPAGGIVERVFM